MILLLTSPNRHELWNFNLYFYVFCYFHLYFYAKISRFQDTRIIKTHDIRPKRLDVSSNTPTAIPSSPLIISTSISLTSLKYPPSPPTFCPSNLSSSHTIQPQHHHHYYHLRHIHLHHLFMISDKTTIMLSSTSTRFKNVLHILLFCLSAELGWFCLLFLWLRESL